MQITLPIFPLETTLISPCAGVYEKDGIVQYIVNGLPSFSHGKDDHNSFRFYTSNLVHQHLCRKSEIERCFQVSESSVTRYYKMFVASGGRAFFAADTRSGRPNKLVGDKLHCVQLKLDKGQSNSSIAREEGISESAIRYALKQGYLKKNLAPAQR